MSGIARVTDAFFLLTIASGSLPESVVPKIYIGPVALPYALLSMAGGSLALEALFDRGSDSASKSQVRLGWMFWVAVVVGLLLAVSGTVYGSQLKYFVIDACMYGGLLLGFAFVRRRGEAHLTRWVRTTVAVVTLFWVLTVVGLVVGFVAPAETGVRIYVSSIFDSPIVCAFLVQYLIAAFDGQRVLRLRVFLSFVVLFIFVTAVVSATRSQVLVGVTTIAVASRIPARTNLVRDWFIAFAFVAVAGLLVTDVLNLGYLQDRIQSSDLDREGRALEFRTLLRSMYDHEIFGRGLGARFPSPIDVDGDGMTLSPHLGAFTFYLKGGILLFVPVIVVFGLRAVFGALLRRGDAMMRAGYAGIIVYLSVGFSSGGWSLSTTFCFGFALSLAFGGKSPHRARRIGEGDHT